MKTLEEIKAMSLGLQKATQDELYVRIESNDIEKVKEFLQEYPLQESFYENNFRIQDNPRSDPYEFPLFSVVGALARAAIVYDKYKSPAMLEFLQEYGLKIDCHGIYGENALTEYIKLGWEDEVVIKYLLDKGLTCERIGKERRVSGMLFYGQTPMHYWAKAGNYKALRVAITKAGANVDVKDKRATPLFEAISSRSDKTVQTLIELGANVNYYNGGYTPLDKARGAKIQKLLKDAGAKTSSSREIKKFIDESFLLFGINRYSREEYDEYLKLPKEQQRKMDAEMKDYVNQKILEMMSKKKDK